MLQANRVMLPASQVKAKSNVGSPQLLLLALAIAGSLPAQDILKSTPSAPLVPPVLRDNTQPPALSRPPAPPTSPYKIGLIVLHPSLSYGYQNAEGLPSRDGRRIASEIHTVSAGLSADLGEYWSVEYSPTWVNYTARAMRDSFDQDASLTGAIPFRDWELQFSERYTLSSPTLIETGRQTEQETWATSLSTSYSFNPSVQLQVSGGLNERYTDISPDTRTWTTGISVNLVFSPRLSLNLGPGFSYSEITATPDMYNESYKLTFGFNTGMQYNHSKAMAAVDLSNPLLNFSLGYQPFETTSLSFLIAQEVSPSYFGNQVMKGLNWSVSLNQRLLRRFYLNVSYAPVDSKYIAIDSVTVASRRDSVETYNASLTTQLFGRLEVSGTFRQTENRSTQRGLSFSSKQYGVRLAFRY
jgi:hypothetical protein